MAVTQFHGKGRGQSGKKNAIFCAERETGDMALAGASLSSVTVLTTSSVKWGEPSTLFTEGIRLHSHSHFAITPVLHGRVKQKVGCSESSLLQGTQHSLLGQAGVGQRLTISSRMSTFSRSRLFSSSSCWFRLRKRCSSLRSPRKLPDSWRKEGGQNQIVSQPWLLQTSAS